MLEFSGDKSTKFFRNERSFGKQNFAEGNLGNS